MAVGPNCSVSCSNSWSREQPFPPLENLLGRQRWVLVHSRARMLTAENLGKYLLLFLCFYFLPFVLVFYFSSYFTVVVVVVIFLFRHMRFFFIILLISLIYFYFHFAFLLFCVFLFSFWFCFLLVFS